jgi:hypothetical protein
MTRTSRAIFRAARALAAASILTGCAGGKAKPAGAAPGGGATAMTGIRPDPSPKQLVVQGNGGSAVPRPGQQVLRLSVYQITVPRGAVSRSDEFWKRVDEHTVDAATYDLLLRNGVRVGLAPAGEWEQYFKQIVEFYPAATQASTATGFGNAGATELSLKKGVGYQDLFYLAPGDATPRGRTYEDCEDLLSVTYQPVPRRPDHVRVKVCPLVRGMRKRYEVSVRGEEREVRYVQPEQLYDLNLEAEIPPGSFLVIAPSQQGLWPMNVGNTFLTRDGPAEQFELVLLLVPRLTAVDEAPAAEQTVPADVSPAAPTAPTRRRGRS